MLRGLKNITAVFVLLSLLTHAILFMVLLRMDVPPVPQKAANVEVEYLAPDELTPPAPVEKSKPAGTKLKDQIVEQKKQLNDEKPEDSRFLSAFNQKVLQQTKAERNGKFENTAKGGQPDEGSPDGDKKQQVMNDDKPVKKPREKGELPSLRDLSPKFALTPGPKGPKLEENGNPSQTDDHLKDVNTGLQTLLSTREFVYYAYYSRIKDALRQHWEPTVREKVKIIYRQGRSIASATDRVTQVLVTLNKNGELIKVEVLTQSGVEALDSAAVESFRAAAPFPNPPKGMVESDGTVKIRWDFVLEA